VNRTVEIWVGALYRNTFVPYVYELRVTHLSCICRGQGFAVSRTPRIELCVQLKLWLGLANKWNTPRVAVFVR
jgi:hypothetical protein